MTGGELSASDACPNRTPQSTEPHCLHPFASRALKLKCQKLEVILAETCKVVNHSHTSSCHPLREDVPFVVSLPVLDLNLTEAESENSTWSNACAKPKPTTRGLDFVPSGPSTF